MYEEILLMDKEELYSYCKAIVDMLCSQVEYNQVSIEGLKISLYAIFNHLEDRGD